MAIHRDKNNNLHPNRTAMKTENVRIDADYILKTVFFQDDVSRSMTLQSLTKEAVSALAAWVYQRDKTTTAPVASTTEDM
jgi:hypothetical protein